LKNPARPPDLQQGSYRVPTTHEPSAQKQFTISSKPVSESSLQRDDSLDVGAEDPCRFKEQPLSHHRKSKHAGARLTQPIIAFQTLDLEKILMEGEDHPGIVS